MSSVRKRLSPNSFECAGSDGQSYEFWRSEADKLAWHKPYTRIIDLDATPVPRWFPDGEINTCYNAVDRHVENGRGEQTAIIFDSAMTGIKQNITYKELQDQTAIFAGAMTREGIVKGDRVIIYMPMVPEALIAMLACARLGAIHSVVWRFCCLRIGHPH